MPGVLYLVATPIGNLEDITLRALRVLKEVAVVAAEDTRRTRQLLSHFGISTPLVSVRAHNERQQTPILVRRLQDGESVALVSDAGTPLVSDPGAALVKEARSAEIRVEAVPGASAVLAALAASGLADEETGGFHFIGFLPKHGSSRARALDDMLRSPLPSVFFEAPHRIESTLAAWSEVAGSRRIAVCRELTKLHEEIIVGKCEEVVDRVSVKRGEFTVVVAARTDSEEEPGPVDASVVLAEFGELTKSSPSRRAAVAAIAAKYGRPQREIYRIVTNHTIGQTTE